jgi:hypothetical protein
VVLISRVHLTRVGKHRASPTSTYSSGGHTNYSHSSSRRLHGTGLHALHYVHYLVSAPPRTK